MEGTDCFEVFVESIFSRPLSTVYDKDLWGAQKASGEPVAPYDLALRADPLLYTKQSHCASFISLGSPCFLCGSVSGMQTMSRVCLFQLTQFTDSAAAD